MSAAMGFDIIPNFGGATSFAAPLGLARFMNLRYGRHEGEPMSDALIATILNEMTPHVCSGPPGNECLYQDPLKFGDVEAARFGYRPIEFIEAN